MVVTFIVVGTPIIRNVRFGGGGAGGFCTLVTKGGAGGAGAVAFDLGFVYAPDDGAAVLVGTGLVEGTNSALLLVLRNITPGTVTPVGELCKLGPVTSIQVFAWPKLRTARSEELSPFDTNRPINVLQMACNLLHSVCVS